MVRDIIDVAITQHKPLEITYSKDGINANVFHLEKVSYSQKYGNNYISGYCEKHKSEMTFCIDRIIHAEVGWVDVFGKDTCASQDGLYVVMCRSDMHLEFELRNYKKWTRLQDIYHNEDGIESCHSSVDVLAYHYIPYFTEEAQREWIPFEHDSRKRRVGFYTFAYIITDSKPLTEDSNDCVDDSDNRTESIGFPSPWELTNTKMNGIHYTVDVLGAPFDRLRIPNNIKVLAYNHCAVYREEEHANHWRLADELGY